MSVIVPINSEYIVELLFENSEQFSNDIYINLMNLMKIYHDLENNHDEIQKYLDENKKNIDKKFIKIIKKFIKKEEYEEPCYCYIPNFKVVLYLFCFFSFLMSFAGFIAYSIITNRHY